MKIIRISHLGIACEGLDKPAAMLERLERAKVSSAHAGGADPVAGSLPRRRKEREERQKSAKCRLPVSILGFDLSCSSSPGVFFADFASLRLRGEILAVVRVLEFRSV